MRFYCRYIFGFRGGGGKYNRLDILWRDLRP